MCFLFLGFVLFAEVFVLRALELDGDEVVVILPVLLLLVALQVQRLTLETLLRLHPVLLLLLDGVLVFGEEGVLGHSGVQRLGPRAVDALDAFDALGFLSEDLSEDRGLGALAVVRDGRLDFRLVVWLLVLLPHELQLFQNLPRLLVIPFLPFLRRVEALVLDGIAASLVPAVVQHEEQAEDDLQGQQHQGHRDVQGVGSIRVNLLLGAVARVDLEADEAHHYEQAEDRHKVVPPLRVGQQQQRVACHH